MNNIFFIKRIDDVIEYLFADLHFTSEVRVIEFRKSLFDKVVIGAKSPCYKFFKKIGLNHFIYLLKIRNKIEKFIKQNDVIIICAQILNDIDISLFRRLKNKYNCKLCILCYDSVHASSPTFQAALPYVMNNKWDKVYTFDENDAKEFSWESLQLNYFSTKKYSLIPVIDNPEYDFYFTGSLKGNREELIFSTYKKLIDAGSKINFSVTCKSSEYEKYSREYDGINFYKSWRPYEDIIKETVNSRCIVEILQENQKAQSIRYFEALYFNKKLLTNNPNIVNMPYYNPRYMHYFKTAADIDINWVKDDVEVNYNYKNDFTPLNFIEQVKRDFPL
ncbi:MAG: hypothetical protein K6D95_03280 [Treponema sp.]|nr:hypothetical protein [Treponema sp.]